MQSKSKLSITRLMTILGAFAACVFAIAIPSVYYAISINEEQQALRIEAAYLAKSIEKIIQSRPEMWVFEYERLFELISKPSVSGHPDERTIRSDAGTVVVKNDSSVIRPAITVSAIFFDSGNPVGSIEVKHSIHEQVFFTALLGMFSSIFGYLFFFIFRTYPIRKLESTLIDLRQERDKSDKTLYTIGDGVISVDPKGKVLFINRVAESLVGMDASEARGRQLEEVYVLRQGQENHVGEKECLLISKGGKEYAIEEVRTPLLTEMESDKSGVVITFRDITERKHMEEVLQQAHDELEQRVADRTEELILANKDLRTEITERKRAEKELRESEENYRLLVENANDAIFIVQDSFINFSNNRTVEAFGYTAEELARIPFTQHIHPEDRDMVVDLHRKRLQGDPVPHIYSFRVLDGSGEELFFETNTVRVDWEGRPATLNFMRDVTEQNRLESQLFHAQKMEAVGTMAGGLAHDFNNLLAGILGNASLAKTGMNPSDQNYGRIKNIVTIVESAVGLTRQLLAFSRGGKIDIRASNINDVIEETAAMFSRTNKEVVLHRNLDKELWPAEVDRGQMEQVFLNLFVNAWQAMPGGGDLYLDTFNTVLTETDLKHPYMKPGRYVTVSVTDTGTGMDEKIRTRIFEPFFSTKEMGRGTGLGLSIVYGIVKRHNGYINVYSEPGKGTTFSIYLPASEKEVPLEAHIPQEMLKGTETILIVDDEEMNLDVSKEILELLGYTVYTASSGTEALALYTEKKGEFDLIILDMIMPGMSGSETYDRLKKLNPFILVILCSGYSIDGDAQKIMDKGCNGFIQKPFDLTNLSQKIREVLDEKT